MKQDLRFGRVAGIEIGASWTVGVVLVIIAWLLGEDFLPGRVPQQPPVVYWAVAVVAAALFLMSLLAHEVSHALLARRNGLKVRAITLWMLGGVAELEGEPPDAGADLRIAAVGPAVSAVTGGIFLGAAFAVEYAGGPAVVTAAGVWLALMNGMLAVFNMLPGAPLDGGRVLRAILWRHYRDRRRAAIAAARAGRFLGAAMVAAGLAYMVLWSLFGGIWLVMIGWFLAAAAAAEERATAATSALEGLSVADVMTAQPQVAPGWSTVQDFIDDVAARSRQDAFPVVNFDGTLAGVLVTGLLASIPREDRARLRVDRVALAVPPSYLDAPADPAGPLLARPPLGGEVVAIVLADGRVVGMVTVADLRQAAWRRRLATAPDSG